MPKRWASPRLAHPISVDVPCGSVPGAEHGCGELCWPALTQDSGVCSQLASTQRSEGFLSGAKGACRCCRPFVCSSWSLSGACHCLCTAGLWYCSVQRSPVLQKGGSLKMFHGLFLFFFFFVFCKQTSKA